MAPLRRNEHDYSGAGTAQPQRGVELDELQVGHLGAGALRARRRPWWQPAVGCRASRSVASPRASSGPRQARSAPMSSCRPELSSGRSWAGSPCPAPDSTHKHGPGPVSARLGVCHRRSHSRMTRSRCCTRRAAAPFMPTTPASLLASRHRGERAHAYYVGEYYSPLTRAGQSAPHGGASRSASSRLRPESL
jgi:hypothetical protein